MRAIRGALVPVMFLFLMTGCATKTQTGTAVGAGAGAVVGGAIGKAAGNTVLGAILGAAVGGTAGAIIGDYMDRQAAELDEALDGATVERIGEGIKITFDTGILFDVDQSTLKPAVRTELTNLSRVLRKYDETEILIEGHTDSTGPEEYNQALSERRARAVGDYIVNLDVAAGRVTRVGYGETQPIASNDTVNGRQQNRRVDIAIMADEELKERAARQAR